MDECRSWDAKSPRMESLPPKDYYIYIGVSKNRGTMGYPKMDGENNGKPY